MFGKTNYRFGGTRGGQNQFEWESVKADKHRENYLGHSLMAPTGRWQRGKDLQWYNKLSESQKQAAQSEKDLLRDKDEDMLNEALGLKPKTRRGVETQLEPSELRQLFARGGAERDITDIERVEGLGAAPSKVHEHIPQLTLAQKELLRLEQEAQRAQATALVNLAEVQPSLEHKEDNGEDIPIGSTAHGGEGDVQKIRDGEKEKKGKKEKTRKKEKKEKKSKHKHKHKSGKRKRDRDNSEDDVSASASGSSRGSPNYENMKRVRTDTHRSR